MSRFLGYEGFVWFIGKVEDIDDPLKLGRVKVRVNNVNTQDKTVLPTEKLLWATPVQGINSAAIQIEDGSIKREVGRSPTGLLVDSHVVGFFADGESAQYPLIMGTFAANPGYTQDDPTNNALHEVNKLTRADDNYEHPVIKKKNDARTKSIPTANGGTSWDEPESAYNAVYPRNHVTETESGHIKEYDDSVGTERIHEYHRKGTFYEIDANGNRSTRIVANNFTVVAGTDYVNVQGDVNLTVDSNCRTYIKGNWNIQVDGNVIENIKGTLTQTVDGTVTETYKNNQKTDITGTLDLDASTEIDADAGVINLN
jgi:hypothetical protein